MGEQEKKIIDIEVKVDKTNVDSSFEQIKKQAISVSKSGDKMGESLEGVEKQAKNTANQIQKAFQKVNMSGLIKCMNKAKETVSKSMEQVKNQTKISDLFSEVGNIRHLQVKLETSKSKEDAIALGNALASLDEKAKKAGVSLSSLGKIQHLNKILAESDTRLTNAQRLTMMNYSHFAISQLRRVRNEQGKLGKSIGSTLLLYKRGAPQVSSAIDKIKKKIVEWKESHVSASKNIKDANKSLTSSFKSVLSAVAPYVGLYAIFKRLKNAIHEAMQAVETDHMFNTVMGGSSKEMNKWVNEVNETLGLGITNTKQYSSIITQMGRAMGLTGQQAMEMSKKMTVMAGDISSFYDAELVDVQRDLRSALSGSFETMDKYGIVLRQSIVDQYAWSHGIAETGKQLTNAQRAMATTALIESQLGLANGDLKDSLDLPANQARVLHYNLTDLSVALGKCFIPITTVVLPILNSFVKALTTTINAIANFISQVFALFGVNVNFGVGGAINDMATSIEDADVGSGNLADNLASGADSADKIKRSLSGFDEINLLSNNSSSPSSSGGSGSTGGISGGNIDTGAIDNGLAQVETKFSKWAEKVAGALQMVWTSLSNGWNSVSDYIDSSLGNLKRSFANLGGSIESFLIGAWNNGGEELIYNFGRLGGALTGLALDINSQIVDAVAKLFDHMNPDNNVNTRKFINAMNKALEACQNFALSAGGWLKSFMDNGGQEFLNNIGDICTIIGTTLVDAVADGIQAITDFLNSTKGQETIKKFAKALEGLSEKLETLSGWVRDNKDWLIILGGVMIGVTKGMKLGAKAIKGVSLAFQGWGWISGFITIISGAFSWLWGTILVPIGNAIVTGLGVIAGFFGVSVGWIVVAIGVLIGAVVLLWKNWDWLCDKAGELWKGLQTYWEYIKVTTINKVKAMVEGVKEWWSDLVTNTIDKFNQIKNGIADKWAEIKTNVDTSVTNIKNSIRDKFTEAYTNVTDIFTKIRNEITGKINDAKDAVKKAVGKIKDTMNFKWSLPHLKLPKISISGEFSLKPPKAPTFGISWHRQGGVLPAGSNAIFGMNGNKLMAGGELSTGGEAILPLSDLFKEMRNMFAEQNQQLISSLSLNNDDQPVEIILQVGETQFGRVSINSINKVQRQSGRILLDVDL